MWGILLLGFAIGLRHALEADHVAAVATLAAQSTSMGRTFRLGAAWGVGHSLPLFGLGIVVLVTGLVLPEALGRWLDVAVGGMLVLLGADVLRRMARAQLHFHVHRHRDGVTHLHAHAHPAGGAPAPLHEHGHGLTLRALAVGVVHGLAGSGALVLLTLQTLHSVALGLTYIALFALGSLAGMSALTAAIAVPLGFAARRLTVALALLQGVVGLGTCALGAHMVATLLWP